MARESEVNNLREYIFEVINMFRSIFNSEPKPPIYQDKPLYGTGLVLENFENGYEGLDGLSIRVLNTTNGVIADGILIGPVFSNTIGEKKIMAKTGSNHQIEKAVFLSDIGVCPEKRTGQLSIMNFTIFEGFNAAIKHLFSIQNDRKLVGLM